LMCFSHLSDKPLINVAG